MSELRLPAIVVNFKAYREVEGAGSVVIAQACQEVSESSGINIIACPPMVELGRVAVGSRIPVMAQHVDPKLPGSQTGWVTPQMVRAAGAIGTLLNHSEHRLPHQEVARTVTACRTAGLLTCVCADTPANSGMMATFGPDMVAVEPPELIGGDISVTEARPEVVSEAVSAVRSVDAGIPVLCGAGVKTGKDVKKAIDLGAKGVLLASGVVKAKDPRAAIEDLVRLI